MPLGWRIVADLHEAGTNLTRDALKEALRASGTKISTQRATVLLKRLRAEAPAEPPMHAEDGDRPQGTSGGPSSVPGEDGTGTNTVSSSPALSDDTTNDINGETA